MAAKVEMDSKSTQRINDKARLYYMTIFAQSFSPCGKYLVAANNYGKIAVFNVDNIINPDSNKVQDEDMKYPMFTFQAHSGPIYTLCKTDKFLISAGVGDILAWSWQDLINKNAKIAWSLSIPESDILGKPETNAIVLGESDRFTTLYSGGGDNNVYEWDLETRIQKRSFRGHTDYIHCLTATSQNECVTGSEDGSVRIWDVRKPTGEAILIEPHKSDKCSRPKYGKWIGCVAVDSGNDWLICGGGPALTLWHLASLTPTTMFEAIEGTVMCCGFHEDLVMAGGGDPNFYHLSYNGDLKTKIPTSASSIYSIEEANMQQSEMVSVAGTSHKIDVCTSFKYRDFTIFFT